VLLEIATIGRAKPVQQQKGKCDNKKASAKQSTFRFAENPERSSQILPLSIEWLTIQGGVSCLSY
jgi:hypothetical protein